MKRNKNFQKKLNKYISKASLARQKHEERVQARSAFLEKNENVRSPSNLKIEVDFNKLFDILKNRYYSDSDLRYSNYATMGYSGAWSLLGTNMSNETLLMTIQNQTVEEMFSLILQNIKNKVLKREDIIRLVYTTPTIISAIPEKYLDEEIKTIAVEYDPHLISSIEDSSYKLQKYILEYYSCNPYNDELGKAYEMIVNPKKSIFLKYVRGLLKEFNNSNVLNVPTNTDDFLWIYQGMRFRFKERFEHIISIDQQFKDLPEFTMVSEALEDIHKAEEAEKLLEEVKKTFGDLKMEEK